MSCINLLPWREEKIFHKNNIFYLYCVIVSIISIIFMLFVNFYVGLLVNIQHGNIEFLNKEIAIYQEKIKEINGLKERKEMALSRAEIINSLQVKRAYLIKILNGLIKSVPDGLVFNQVGMRNNNLRISGQCESNSRVSLFMRNLEKQAIFSNPNLEEILVMPSQSTENNISFTLQVKVSE